MLPRFALYLFLRVLPPKCVVIVCMYKHRHDVDQQLLISIWSEHYIMSRVVRPASPVTGQTLSGNGKMAKSCNRRISVRPHRSDMITMLREHHIMYVNTILRVLPGCSMPYHGHARLQKKAGPWLDRYITFDQTTLCRVVRKQFNHTTTVSVADWCSTFPDGVSMAHDVVTGKEGM